MRSWLEWNEDHAVFEGDDTEIFYDLITPSIDDSGNLVDPKLLGYSHVRELRKILAKPEAKAILLDPHKSLQDAINVAHQDDLAKSWLSAVSAAVSALDRMGIRDVKKLTRDDEFVLTKLRDLAMERLADRAALIDRSSAR